MVQRKYRKAFGCITLLFILLTATPLFAKEPNKFKPSGPFNVRNQMPMYVFYMQMGPETAQTVKKGNFNIDSGCHITNTIIKQHDPWPSWKAYSQLTYDLLIDAEIARFYADVRYGLLDNLELSAYLPFLDYSGGFLDSFIEGFEDAFEAIKTPNAREQRPRDAYRVKVVHLGETVVDNGSDPDGIGEMVLQAKYKALNENGNMPAVSLRGAIKLPTSSNEILGSDKIDYGFGILLDKKLLNRLYLYLNFNIAFIERPDILDKLNVDDYMLSGLFGLEFFLKRGVWLFNNVFELDDFQSTKNS